MMTITSPDGTTLAVQRSGHGAPLLLVHGTTADHTRWEPILPLLEPHHTVYAMDRRGRGGSGDAPDYDLTREFEDVAAVVDAIAAEHGTPVAVYGHSYGALCSLGAATLTTNIGALVLYEPPGVKMTQASTSEIHTRIQERIAAGEPEAGLEIFIREVVGMPEDQLEVFRAMPAWQARIAAAHTIVREEVAPASFDVRKASTVGVRTMLLSGTESPDDLKADTASVAAVLPDAVVVPFEGQQHVGDVLEPETFAQHLRSFLDE